METEQGRNKGVRKDDGKIIKGTLTQAPMKLKASSIPSKIENVIYNNHHRAAFGNSQERFYTPTRQKIMATPGPCNYDPGHLDGRVDSKKGFGFFASQSNLSRFNDKRNWNPGPGRYELQKQSKRLRINTVYLSSSLQARELFKSEMKATIDNPGPGNYEQRLFRSISAANTVFQSRKIRFTNVDNDTPGVGEYNWQVVKSKVKSLKFTKNASLAKFNDKSFKQKYLDKLMGDKIDTKTEMGPGKYNPSLMESKKSFLIKTDLKDRFGVVKEAKQSGREPVEQHWSVGDVVPANKEANAHASVFKSKSRRYEFGESESKLAGDPGKYSPSKVDKYSHLVNFTKKWI